MEPASAPQGRFEANWTSSTRSIPLVQRVEVSCRSWHSPGFYIRMGSLGDGGLALVAARWQERSGLRPHAVARCTARDRRDPRETR
jgi:hypothetical protein